MNRIHIENICVILEISEQDDLIGIVLNTKRQKTDLFCWIPVSTQKLFGWSVCPASCRPLIRMIDCIICLKPYMLRLNPVVFGSYLECSLKYKQNIWPRKAPNHWRRQTLENHQPPVAGWMTTLGLSTCIRVDLSPLLIMVFRWGHWRSRASPFYIKIKGRGSRSWVAPTEHHS